MEKARQSVEGFLSKLGYWLVQRRQQHHRKPLFCVWSVLFAYVCVYCVYLVTIKARKWHWVPLKFELQALVSYHMGA